MTDLEKKAGITVGKVHSHYNNFTRILNQEKQLKYNPIYLL